MLGIILWILWLFELILVVVKVLIVCKYDIYFLNERVDEFGELMSYINMLFIMLKNNENIKN